MVLYTLTTPRPNYLFLNKMEASNFLQIHSVFTIAAPNFYPFSWILCFSCPDTDHLCLSDCF